VEDCEKAGGGGLRRTVRGRRVKGSSKADGGAMAEGIVQCNENALYKCVSHV
jgi:hypothetical protein